ncbi:MAG: DsrE family protein [Bacteroidota bacterium]
MQIKFTLTLISLLLFSIQILAQNRTKGPAVKNYGPTFPVDNPDFVLDTSQTLKVVFDIYNTPEDPSRVNSSIETMARFLNMHVQAGMPLSNLKVACVIHNKASKDAMDTASYKEKYGVDNPNISMMEELTAAGAEIYMCGQSMYARGYDRERLAEPVQVALSAMTVILSLQTKGYQLIKF